MSLRQHIFHFHVRKWVLGISKHDEDIKNKPEGSWRKRLGEIIEGQKVQAFVLILTLCDLILVGVDLFLEEHYAKCSSEETGGEGGEGEKEEDSPETAEKVLGILSLIILCILGAEILLVLISFGWKFFKHFFYVLDMVVIGLSLLFEIKFKESVGTLLIIFRLWRLIRIAHGVAVELEEREKEKLKKIEAQNKELKSTIENLQKQLDTDSSGTVMDEIKIE